jgi:2-polyprenyl-6-methoxyphenol hydroxylase-like FAD-dependent oxidoreductase
MAVTNGTTNGHSLPNTTSNGTSNTTTTNNKPNGRSSAASSSSSLPVLISGGGCVGLFLALLLSHSSPPIPNTIIVIEPQTPDPTSTRAMAHQPPTYPLLSRVPDLLPELVAAGSLSSGLCFRMSVAKGSRVIAEKVFDNTGEGMKGKGQLLLPQGKFQEVLMKRLSGREGVDVRIGWRVTSFSSTPTLPSVSVHITNDAGETQDIEATYLIAADGAHSLIRKHLALPFDGETLDAQLVACDIRFPFAEHGFHDANFIIDPEHYGLIGTN